MQRHDSEFDGYNVIDITDLPVKHPARFIPEALLLGCAPRASLDVAVRQQLVEAYKKAESVRTTLKMIPEDCVRGVKALVKRTRALRTAAAARFDGLRPETTPWKLKRLESGAPLKHFGALSDDFLLVQLTVERQAVQAARDICEREAQARVRLAMRFAGVLRTEFADHVHDAPTAAEIAAMGADVPPAGAEAADDDKGDSSGSDDEVAWGGNEGSDLDDDSDGVPDPDDNDCE